MLLCDELILECFLELAEICAGNNLSVVLEQDALVASYENGHGYAELSEEKELIVLCFLSGKISELDS